MDTAADAPERSLPSQETAGPAPRRAARPELHRAPEYAHLTLDGLRGYRKALTTEESKVSYWRRILQARLDVVRAGSGEAAASSQLRPLLTSERVGSARQAIVDVVQADDIPPLPNLAELWDRRIAPDDAVALDRLIADLEAAEQQLSSYRHALHRRISGATDELIARYREEPELCLSALPSRPGRGSVRA